MADKKDDKKKGVVGNYNQQPVTKKKYYYDYNDVSDAEKGFADAFTDLSAFNTKLKDELEKEKNVKLQIHSVDDEQNMTESTINEKKKCKKKKKILKK